MHGRGYAWRFEVASVLCCAECSSRPLIGAARRALLRGTGARAAEGRVAGRELLCFWSGAWRDGGGLTRPQRHCCHLPARRVAAVGSRLEHASRLWDSRATALAKAGRVLPRRSARPLAALGDAPSPAALTGRTVPAAPNHSPRSTPMCLWSARNSSQQLDLARCLPCHAAHQPGKLWQPRARGPPTVPLCSRGPMPWVALALLDALHLAVLL